MKEVARLRRIVAVRTAQRDLSALRLQEAQRQRLLAEQQLAHAEQKLIDAAQPAPRGEQLTQIDLERMDMARIAAWEEIAEWQQSKHNAVLAQESARSQVEAQHLALRQSERLEGQAAQKWQQRLSAEEQRLADERASRGRGKF